MFLHILYIFFNFALTPAAAPPSPPCSRPSSAWWGEADRCSAVCLLLSEPQTCSHLSADSRLHPCHLPEQRLFHHLVQSRLFRPLFTMLQIGDEVLYFSAFFLLVMLGTRSAMGASLLTGFLYIFIVMFRFPPVPADQAGRVLRPRAPSGGVPVVAHRGGCHDAPENTLAAIREVRLTCKHEPSVVMEVRKCAWTCVEMRICSLRQI